MEVEARDATARVRTRRAALRHGLLLGGAAVTLPLLREVLTPRAAAPTAEGATPERPRLFQEGLTVDAHGGLVSLAPGTDAVYAPRSTVLVGGSAIASARRRRELADADRRWLDAGTVPHTPTSTDLATRALLDLRMLVRPNGAVAAAWWPGWDYTWPRDSAFVAAGLVATGHHHDAHRVLHHQLVRCPADGPYEARYLLDGSCRTPDDRPPQGDGGGWLLWATWMAFVLDTDERRAEAHLAALWPRVATTAAVIIRGLGRDGLPAPASDYWEHHESQLALGVVAAQLTGLRCAHELAERTGRTAAADRWGTAASTLASALHRDFRAACYPRYATGTDADSAVTFLAPPFGPPNAAVRDAIAVAARRLAMPQGGMRPGESWKDDAMAWTPSTSMFALASAATGDTDTAVATLRWLDDHRTTLGALPEKVGPDGHPASVAPLAWTAANTLLTLQALAGGLPHPAAP